MKNSFQIDAVTRSDTGKGASRRLRREGMVPGILYGGDKEPELIAASHNELDHHLMTEAFYSSILSVVVGDNPQSVVLKDLQRHPAKPFITHFDLLRVSQTDRIKMLVPLHFLGEETAIGVKEEGGLVMHNVSEIEIICEARNLPEYVEVDVSEMHLGDTLKMSEVKLPEGVDIVALLNTDELEIYDVAVVSIQAPSVEKEEIVEDEGEIVEETEEISTDE